MKYLFYLWKKRKYTKIEHCFIRLYYRKAVFLPKKAAAFPSAWIH